MNYIQPIVHIDDLMPQEMGICSFQFTHENDSLFIKDYINIIYI